jgi:hypothetical protein
MGHPYYIAREIEQLKNPPRDGTPVMNSMKVGVFVIQDNVEHQVGTYIRNFPHLHQTFYYFRKNGKDYALYSPHYTSIRVMELPSCKDIGGTEPHSSFCPVDFYVPWEDERDENLIFVKADFGFVAGVYWAMPYISGYIEYLDLSEVEKGIIKKDQRFGEIEMPVNCTLEQAIFVDEDTFDKWPYAHIGVLQTYNINTGERVP